MGDAALNRPELSKDELDEAMGMARYFFNQATGIPVLTTAILIAASNLQAEKATLLEGDAQRNLEVELDWYIDNTERIFPTFMDVSGRSDELDTERRRKYDA